MAATMMDGKALAERIRADVSEDVRALGGLGLTTVLVGDDPASDIYIRLKHKAAVEVGIRAFDLRLPTTVSEGELLAKVAELNADDEIDALLVQLPLPDGIDEANVLRAVDPAKDVDGSTRRTRASFCTAAGPRARHRTRRDRPARRVPDRARRGERGRRRAKLDRRQTDRRSCSSRRTPR